MEKEIINQIMQIFREAEDKDKAAKMLMRMIKLFEPELIGREKNEDD